MLLASAENIDFNRPLTDLRVIHKLLSQLVCEAQNTVESVPLSKHIKASALFDLYTGVQPCGYINDVADLQALEDCIVRSNKMVTSGMYHIAQTAVHVIELYLPRGYSGVSEIVSFKQIAVLKKLHLVKAEYNVEADRVSHTCTLLEPQQIDSFHFVLTAKFQNGKVQLDRWETGRYFSKNENKIVLGDINEHGKKNTVFKSQWDVLQLEFCNKQQATTVQA